MRKLLLAALLAAAGIARAATSFSTDVTDLWWNPAESGWGVNIIQQGDTIFATFFVYDANMRAHWYVASDMRATQSSADTATFTGTLYETQGPYFGVSFSPSAVALTQVGTATLQFGLPNNATLSYNVNGTPVTKQIVRQTWGVNDLTGPYSGWRVTRGVAAGGCVATSNPTVTALTGIELAHSGSAFSMRGTSGDAGSCQFTGDYSQAGHLGASSGTYSCSSGLQGSYRLSEIEGTLHGFFARYSGTERGCPVEGHLGAVRSTTGKAATFSNDVTDLWWNSKESGWGINIIQQSNILFATLFVYDITGRAHWFVASNMTGSSPSGDGSSTFAGRLYETTGPVFSAASFSSAAVTIRDVGPITFAFTPPNGGTLNYTVDGTAVTKAVTRQTWRSNNLTGTFAGAQVLQKSADSAATCSPKVGLQAFDTLSISHADTTFSMTASSTAAPLEQCRYTGTYSQAGHMGTVDGVYSCDSGANGTFLLRELEAGTHGFAASVVENDRGCGVTGNIAAVRRN